MDKDHIYVLGANIIPNAIKKNRFHMTVAIRELELSFFENSYMVRQKDMH